jgi:DNA repair/transcription protein MET18/MMS19
VVDAVDTVILHEHIEGHGDIKSEAISGLVAMAQSVPAAIREQAIPAFMVELPDVPDEQNAYGPVLEAFAQLSVEPQVFDTVVLRIKNKLSAARYQNATVKYQRDLLLALLYAFTYGTPLREDGVMRSTYFTDYAEPLIIQLKDALPSERSDALTEIIGRIANVILRTQTPHFQSTIYNKYMEWMSPVDENLANAANERVRTLAPFSLYYYAAIRPEIAEPADIVVLLRSQAQYLLSSQADSNGTRVVLRHLSLLINKFLAPAAMRQSLADAGIEVNDLLTAGYTGHMASAAFAVVKALVIQGRCGALTSEYIKLLLQTVPQSDKAFAHRFTGILAPDDVLTKENHCVISGLYKQKIFNQTVGPLVESMQSADTEGKLSCLVALSGVLRWLPYSIMQSSLSSLMSPLLLTLDIYSLAKLSPDEEVIYSTLTIFESVLMHDPSIASEHTVSLINRFLSCSEMQRYPAKIRAKALQCLTLVPRQFKPESVVPYRRPTVKKLLGCLDDSKRNVRAEAVKCRSAWLALDEGNEEEE